MDHLVDTCALLLFLEDDPRLPAAAVARIEDPSSRSYVSLISLWEIAIKVSLGKLRFDHADRPDLPELLTANGFHLLSPGWDVLRKASFLPAFHRDPFDRVILAECQLRGLPVISSDGKFDAYQVTRLWG